MLPVLLVPALIAAPTPKPKPKDTPPYDLASEYIRELCELWEIQGKADQELIEDKASSDAGTAALMTSIRNSTRVSLAVRTNIGRLKKMRLTREPNEGTLKLFIGAYEQKLQFHNDLINIATTFLGGEKPGVDYGKLAAQMPKLTVMLDEVDHNLFRMNLLMFGALIDMKPDSRNQCSHLLITKKERDALVETLDSYFGASLEIDRRYLSASASLMKKKLLEFKCSDDPWD